MNQVLNFKAFSKAIRQKRIIDLKIGLREAADLIGINFSTLSRCENEKMPELIAYANICKWLNVSMDKFIFKARKNEITFKFNAKKSGYVSISKEQLLAPKQKINIKYVP